MSRRIDIELTSSRPDGTWTWRAAGAREPKGVVEASLLPNSVKVGDVLKVEAESDLDGFTILSVVQGRTKLAKFETIDIVVDHSGFKPVIETRAPRTERRGGRPERRRDGDRPDRRRDAGRPGQSRDGRNRDGQSRDGANRDGANRDGAKRDGSTRGERRRDDRPRRPRFEVPPEIPMRPKPKRLRPQNKHRRDVLETIPAEQRAIAELALKGIPAVRQRLAEENARLTAAGQPLMPEHSVIEMAQNLLPRLRVAEWRDRAEAAKRDGDELDLRDLRSVVAAAKDPLIEREESCRALASELVEILNRRAVADKDAWLVDIEAATGVGRVVRALKLAGQPPKAGERFPEDLGRRLAAATADSLTLDAPSERWIAVLEAVAFSPVRSAFMVPAVPSSPTPELLKTVERLSPLLPKVAALFGVDATGRPTPRPLMAPRGPVRDKNRKPAAKPGAPVRTEVPATTSPETTAPETTAPEPVTTDTVATETSAPEPVTLAPVDDPVVENPSSATESPPT